jgi:exodeoxyribonuclease VII small subunit
MAEQRFEDAISRLEQIVTDLEGQNLDLDDAIKQYEEGMKLAAFCSKRLKQAKSKIEILVKDATGRLSAKNFDEADITEQKPEDKAKSTGKRKRPKGESLLF